VSEADPAGRILLDNVSSPAGQITSGRSWCLSTGNLGENLALTFSQPGRRSVLGGQRDRDPAGQDFDVRLAGDDVELTADGVTQTKFTGYNATAGALITVDPQLDTQGDYLPEGTVTIVSPTRYDADPDVAGHHLSVDPPFIGQADGYSTYTIVHPSVAGTLRVMYTEVTGAQASCFSVDFVAPSVRRFDFNSGASPTQTPAAQWSDGRQRLTSACCRPAHVAGGGLRLGDAASRLRPRGAGQSGLQRPAARRGVGQRPRDFRMQLPRADLRRDGDVRRRQLRAGPDERVGGDGQRVRV
jgi:hypothetical protein